MVYSQWPLSCNKQTESNKGLIRYFIFQVREVFPPWKKGQDLLAVDVASRTAGDIWY